METRQVFFLENEPSWLECVRSVNHFMRDSRKLRTTWVRIFENPELSEEELELSNQAYFLLTLLYKDEACAFVRFAEDGSDYQVWQTLLRTRTARNTTNLVNMLLESTFTSPDPQINLWQWNKNAEEYATRTSERVSDEIRGAAYMNKIAPQVMRQHLMLISVWPRLKMLPSKLKITGINWRVFTWWEEPSWIRCSSWWRFCETRERWNTWWNEQWQGKVTQRVWIPTWAGWVETFWRYCNWCWLIDHKESQYWFEWEDAENNPTQDPLQRDIREWSGSSEKG